MYSIKLYEQNASKYKYGVKRSFIASTLYFFKSILYKFLRIQSMKIYEPLLYIRLENKRIQVFYNIETYH